MEKTYIDAHEISKPRLYEWKPKEDISAYELALCLPVFQCKWFDIQHFIDSLPESARRHFVEITS